MEEVYKCSGMIRGTGSWGYLHKYHCPKTGKVERDGKWYCGTHDPVKIKERQEKRNAKWEAESEAQIAKYRAENIQKYRNELLNALCRNIPTELIQTWVTNYKTLAEDGVVQ